MDHQLPAGVTRTTDPGGRDALQLSAADTTVLVAQLGAQVLSFRTTAGDAEISHTIGYSTNASAARHSRKTSARFIARPRRTPSTARCGTAPP